VVSELELELMLSLST